jgi:O-antigen/teichoic acid export membrane protein
VRERSPKLREDLQLILENVSETKTLGPLSASDRHILTAAKGSSILFAGRLFAYLSRLAITFLLARLLGAQQLGLYNLSISAATVASGLGSLGLDAALIRYVAISASRRDEAGLWGALQVCVGISSILSVLTGTCLFALAYPIAEQVFHEPKLTPLLQLVSVIVPFLTMSDVLAGAISGFKKMQYVVLAQNISQPMIRLVLIVGLAIIGLNATKAVVVYGLADCVASVVLLYFLHKQFSLRRALHTARRDTRTILSFSLPIFLSELMATFRGNVQTLLLGAMNTVRSVGIFSVASNFNLIREMLHQSVTTSVKPLIAELHDKRAHGQMERLYQAATGWVLTLDLPVFLSIVLFPAPLLFVFGKSFVEGSAALTILAWATLANVGTGVCGAIIDMTGYTKLKLVNSIIRLSLALCLSYLLIPRWGMVGAATAALVAEGTVNVLRLLEVFILFRMLPYNMALAKPVAAALIATAATIPVSRFLPATVSPIYAAINVAILLGVYTGVILLVGLSPEERAIVARVRRRASAKLSRG